MILTRRKGLSLMPVFGMFAGSARARFAGIDNLDPLFWGRAPEFRYRGIDANLTGWIPWGYGPTLTYYGTSLPPNLGVTSSPYLGPSSGAVELFGNNGAAGPGSYQDASSTTAGDVTTGDIIVELVIKFVSGGAGWIMSKGAYPTGNVGWLLYYDSIPNWVVPGNAICASYGAASGFDHYVFSYDRNGNGSQSIRHIRNGVLKNLGSPQTTNTLTNSYRLTINGKNDRASTQTHFHIAYAAMWTAADLVPYDHTLVDAAVLARYNALQGNWA
jgi:hypothetical protein